MMSTTFSETLWREPRKIYYPLSDIVVLISEGKKREMGGRNLVMG